MASILNSTDVLLPPHSKKFLAATRQGEESDTRPQANSKADKQRKWLHLGEDSKPQAHLQLQALYLFPSRKELHPRKAGFYPVQEDDDLLSGKC